MHPKAKMIFIGVDTHKHTHTAVVITCFNEKLGEVTFDNKASEYQKLLDEVKKHKKRGFTEVYGLEDTGAAGRALAVYLMDNNKMVKKVNSSLSSSERKKHPITQKSDSLDAHCVAKVLLDNLDTLPDANPVDIYWTLGMLVSRRRAIVKSNTALKNQLHAQLVHNYPSYAKFFYNFDCNTALDFWEQYPSPSALKAVTAEELGIFLAGPSLGKLTYKKAKEILEMVKKDKVRQLGYQQSRDFLITNCVRQLKQNLQAISEFDKEIKKLVEQFDYKLYTMPGIEMVTTAELITEIGDIGRFASPDKLAMYSGIAPVSYSSGKTEKNFRCKQGNRELYNIFYAIAARLINCGKDKETPVSPIFHEYYQKKLSQGKTKKQAMIAIMRRLVNIIWGMMKNKTPYTQPDSVTSNKTLNQRLSVIQSSICKQ